MIAVSLLGRFDITVDGSSLSAGLPRRCVSLVGYIMLRRQERIYRDRLAVTLWPDADEAEARGKLRRHLYLVGQAIPQSRRDDWLVSDASTVGWNPAIAVTTDIELMRSAANAGNWAAAVAQYRGELLAECDDEWLVDERERIREGHVTNLERLAAHERAAGSSAAAIAAAQELLRLEPWREAALRILMETRHASGDRAGALAEYERFSQRLRDELDVEPMPETTALYGEIVRRNTPLPVPSLEPAPAAPAATAAAATPFVGREAQFEWLREAWSRALQKRGGVALVGGESGVGKSRLVEELAASVAADGAIVLRGGTTFIETSPYQALVEALRSSPQVALRARDRPWRVPLGTILPELQTGSDGDSATALGAHEGRSRLFEAVVAALAQLAADRPLLVVLEDLHWAGSGTIALLAHVARRIGRERIALIATYRDDDLERGHPLRDLRRQLAREGSASLVSLGALTPGDVERFFALRFPSGVDAALCGRYHAATDGLPLFLTELLAGTSDARALPATVAAVLPPTLAATLERRLADLPEAARTALELASVIGSGFDLEVVAEASGWSEAETLRHVGDLIGKHLVRELTGGGRAYSFAHAFYREDAYARIEPAKRRQRHARVARALAELYSARLDDLALELARHYEEAGEAAAAVGHLIVATRRATDLYANEDALGYAARALALKPGKREEFALRLLREEAFRRLGDRQGQRDELERAGDLAVAFGEPDGAFEIAARRIALAHEIGDRVAERAGLESAELLAPHASPARTAELALARGRHYLRVSAHPQARESLERAARGFQEAGDARGAFDSYLTLAELERIAEAHAAVEACFDNAERQLAGLDDSPAFVMRLYEERANYAGLRGRFLEVDEWAARFLTAAESTGDVGGRARAYRQLGSAAAWRLDVTVARARLGQAAELFEALQDRHQAYAVGYEFALLAVWLGHVDEAVRRFERAMRAAEDLHYTFGVAACCISLGFARTLACDYVRAEAESRRAVELAQQLGAEALLAPALVNLGISLTERGLAAMARAPLQESARLADRIAGRADVGAEARAYLAFAHALSGDGPAARASAAEARRLLGEIPNALRSGSHYWTLGRALHELGDAAEASLTFGEGRDLVRAQRESIPDQESREAFSLLPAHRALLAWETPSVAQDAFRTVYA